MNHTLKDWAAWLRANGCKEEPICMDCKQQWKWLESQGFDREDTTSKEPQTLRH